eukprot:CAMPEP_0202963304 /NCGR_PEP_ID=MMETSP1396-20130829/7286_1 /ASSEMBLY_ACC=CAM_ASM_000872 /TAXON_ID= /ORGANISM="Pseudokeronopsis sp., Strain Brazil" /LENGTH=175 /DNA_ID=CAMNT_0049684391 /DNA_START=124 /DNA_END=651 /DNA_ORIENTATION=+
MDKLRGKASNLTESLPDPSEVATDLKDQIQSELDSAVDTAQQTVADASADIQASIDQAASSASALQSQVDAALALAAVKDTDGEASSLDAAFDKLIEVMIANKEASQKAGEDVVNVYETAEYKFLSEQGINIFKQGDAQSQPALETASEFDVPVALLLMVCSLGSMAVLIGYFLH